jgi:hypothetical protein
MCATNKSYFKINFEEICSVFCQAQLIAELAKVGVSAVFQPLFYPSAI